MLMATAPQTLHPLSPILPQSFQNFDLSWLLFVDMSFNTKICLKLAIKMKRALTNLFFINALSSLVPHFYLWICSSKHGCHILLILKDFHLIFTSFLFSYFLDKTVFLKKIRHFSFFLPSLIFSKSGIILKMFFFN